MQANSFSANRRIPAYAVLALLALAAALAVFLPAPSASAQESTVTVTVNFESSTIADKAYTAGTKVNLGLSQDEIPTLPEVTGITDTHADALGFNVTYSISGLPAGLTMRPGEASDRIIWGAPESATTNPVTVTYKATVTPVRWNQEDGFSEGDPVEATISFDVTVNPAVSWNAEAQKFFKSKIIAYVSGTGWTATTFPEAQGGTGTLTYSLIHNATDLPLADHVSTITFDASTRTIGGTLAEGERYAVTLIATDENGAVAKGYTEVRYGVVGGL